jgi:anti-anti-sigma factor
VNTIPNPTRFSVDCIPDGMIRFVGELDIAGGRLLLDCLDDVERDTCLDLGQVTFIDVAGLHSVLDACCRQAEAHRSLTIIDQSAAVDRILDLVGLPPFG